MAQVKVADVAELTDAMLDQSRMLYRIGWADRQSRKTTSPRELAANLGREVTVQEVAAHNKQVKLDLAATKDEFSAANRVLRDKWIAMIPANATPGSKLRLERIIARIVRDRRAVDAKLLARDVAAVCNMNY